MSTTKTITTSTITTRRLGRPVLRRLIDLGLYEQALLFQGKLQLAKFGDGKQAIQELADEHQCSTRWIAMVRRLAVVWSADEYQELLDREIPAGHLLLLAQMRNAADRQQLLKLLMKERWSFRRLEKEIRRRCRRQRR